MPHDQPILFSCSPIKLSRALSDRDLAWFQKNASTDSLLRNYHQPSTQVPLSEYHRIMETNTSPLYHSASTAYPIFAAQHHGVFINVSSISAPRPRPNLVWYAGSKGAVSTITRGLAAEFAKDNVRCNAVLPVAADTGMLVNVMGGEDTELGRTKLTGGIPLGRFATGEDVGNAVAWLASDEAAFLTGVELPVDGGRSLM